MLGEASEKFQNVPVESMKFTPGSTMTYKVLSSMGGKASGDNTMKISLPMVWKVVSVSKGIATVDTSVGPVTVGTQTMMQPTKNRLQINALGQVQGGRGQGQQVSPTLPAKPIRVGQSWSANTPVSMPMGQQQKLTATYTFKGVKTVAGKQVAELGVVTTGQATGSGSMLLLVADGSVYQSTLKMNLTVKTPDGKPANYIVQANIQRQ